MSTPEVKPSILLVEDSEDDAFFFQRALRRTNVACECVQVWDGAAATKFMREYSNPLLVFLDLKLPILNGLEVLKWVREQPFKSRLQIVVLSGSDDPHDMASARALGVADYLVKPLEAAELKRQLELWAVRTLAEVAT